MSLKATLSRVLAVLRAKPASGNSSRSRYLLSQSPATGQDHENELYMIFTAENDYMRLVWGCDHPVYGRSKDNTGRSKNALPDGRVGSPHKGSTIGAYTDLKRPYGCLPEGASLAESDHSKPDQENETDGQKITYKHSFVDVLYAMAMAGNDAKKELLASATDIRSL